MRLSRDFAVRSPFQLTESALSSDPAMDWEGLHDVSGFLVDCTILIAAVVAAVKLQLFHLLARRWHSDLVCSHWRGTDGNFVFAASYALHNRGQRPLRLEKMEIHVLGTELRGPLFVRDETRVLATYTADPKDEKSSFIEIHSGERMLFQLQCRIPGSEDAVFVDAYFYFVGANIRGRHRGFHCFLPTLSSHPQA